MVHLLPLWVEAILAVGLMIVFHRPPKVTFITSF